MKVYNNKIIAENKAKKARYSPTKVETPKEIDLDNYDINFLKKRQKEHEKQSRNKKALGWWQNMNAGCVPINNAAFNHMMGNVSKADPSCPSGGLAGNANIGINVGNSGASAGFTGGVGGGAATGGSGMGEGLKNKQENRYSNCNKENRMKGRSYNYKQQDSSEWLQKYAEDDFEDIDEPEDLMDDEEMIMPDEAFVDIYDSDPTFEPIYDTIKDYDIECGGNERYDHCEFMEEKSVVTCDGREIKCVLTYDSDDGKYYVTEYDSEAADGDKGITISFDSREDAFTWFDTYSTADDIFDEEDAFGTSTLVTNLPSRPVAISPLDTEYIPVEEGRTRRGSRNFF